MPAKNGRHNKLYRTPPTPLPEEIQTFEQGFVLDCNAVASISSDYSKANPKLGPVVPPYNSQKDKHTKAYFGFCGVDKVLKTSKQETPGTSIEGVTMDRFHSTGAGFRYISTRNAHGAGYSSEQVGGHTTFMSNSKPITGYNGLYGFRRNTPNLRKEPSPFGTACLSSTH